MKIDLISEPELEFGAGVRHVDIRFGLANGGPVDKDTPGQSSEIRIGIVGTNLSIQAVKSWLEQCRAGVPAKVSQKPNLFPAFPGFGSDSCFACDWTLPVNLEGAINAREIEACIKGGSINQGVTQLVSLFSKECRRICDKGGVDVLICAPPQNLLNYADMVTPPAPGDGDDAGESNAVSANAIDFHDMLKAESLQLNRPVQFVRPITYDDSARELTRKGTARELQDPATRAWNFHTALYYKAGRSPWRLIRESSDLLTCYIGIGFYRSLDRESVHTSVAQVFNERGEGMVLRGGDATFSELDKQHHLSKEDISALVTRALNDYQAEHKHWPAHVVIHKTSLFDSEEAAGCDNALNNLRISSRDLVTIRKSFVRLFRRGQYPPLRGTFLELDKDHAILYTRGSVDFFQLYPGMYVPRTLELVCHSVDRPLFEIAQEILALTKMNWNNTQFDAGLPITVEAARRVGRILRYCGSTMKYQNGYAFYM